MIGAADYYKHDIGVLQDGFLSGHNYLLPLPLLSNAQQRIITTERLAIPESLGANGIYSAVDYC